LNIAAWLLNGLVKPRLSCGGSGLNPANPVKGTSMRIPNVTRSILLLATLIHGVAHGADPVTASPEGSVWEAGPGFSFSKKPKDSRRSLSGIACPIGLATPRRCVAVFDEGVEARYVVLGNHEITPEPDSIVLLPGGKELDAEGAARDGDFIYVTGSHASKRGDCANNPDSRHVFRFGIDATGKARLGPDGTPVDLASDNGRLWDLMTKHPELKNFAGDKKCLGSRPPPKAPELKGLHGVDIEGLAARNDKLYFGFRGPTADGVTYILRVAAAPLFAGGDLSEALFRFEVGNGRGIRDMMSVPEGLLILIGPDDDSGDGIGSSIALWNGMDSGDAVIKPTILANLAVPPIRGNDCDKEIKPEAITMLENGSNFRRLLILSDGMCDGGPLVYRVPK
jgi:hypothetical protein